jgi:uncharacterized membrane protein YkvA (DUF1232 family)
MRRKRQDRQLLFWFGHEASVADEFNLRKIANPLLTDGLRCFHSGAVKKAKTKSAKARKTRPAKRRLAPKKSAKEMDSSLQARLQAEFSEAVKSATSYVGDPERLRDLVSEAAKKAASMPRDAFKETWAYFQTMLRLVRAYYRGEYRDVPMTTLVIIIAAIIYVVNPFDMIPDWVPALGLLDDAFVLALAVRRTRNALDEFMVWETAAI